MKNQLFYQNEVGFEAALFHHNKLGGKGLNFDTQTLNLENGNTVEWNLEGRKDDFITGILKESETIEIPFYYDKRTNPNDSEDIEEITENFSLEFSRFEFENDGSVSTTEIVQEIGLNPGQFNFPDNDKLPNGNPDPAFRNNVLINWSVSRKNTDGEIQTFIPRSDHSINNKKSLCVDNFQAQTYNSESSFFCEEYLNVTGALKNTISSVEPIIGYILPGQTPSTLSDFWNQSGTTNRKLRFNPLAFFYNDHDQDTKIKGIPWKLTVNGESIPTPNFTITTTSSYSNGKYSKTETKTLKEKTAISSFDSFNAE